MAAALPMHNTTLPTIMPPLQSRFESCASRPPLTPATFSSPSTRAANLQERAGGWRLHLLQGFSA